MAVRNPSWTRDELILALDLYFRVNPVHISESHPEIMALSKLLNQLPIHTDRPDVERFRNPNGVYMKLCNFLRLDPSYKGVGLDAGSKKDEEVWNEFAGDKERLHRVAEAIRAWAEPSPQDRMIPLEADEDFEAPEGRVILRQHKVRERNTTLSSKRKALAIKEFGELRCEACGFNFREVYGTLGEGFIECHHTVPVSQLRPGQPTRLKDLALVCANCHRMLHQGGEPLTIEALKRIVQAARGLV